MDALLGTKHKLLEQFYKQMSEPEEPISVKEEFPQTIREEMNKESKN